MFDADQLGAMLHFHASIRERSSEYRLDMLLPYKRQVWECGLRHVQLTQSHSNHAPTDM